MYKKIMVPVDGSELSLKAVKECLAFAKSTGATVVAINVVPHRGIVIEEWISSALVRQLEKSYEDVAKQSAGEMLARIKADAAAQGVTCESLVAIGDDPYKEIIDNAVSQECDLIMMASHGRRGLEGLLLGSETVKVLTHCKLPVLVVR